MTNSWQMRITFASRRTKVTEPQICLSGQEMRWISLASRDSIDDAVERISRR
jgi:hypothetical protein